MTLDVEGTYDNEGNADVNGTNKTGYNPATGTLSLYFEKTDWIEAGVPYLVKWTSGSNITDPVFNNFTIFNDDPDETKLVSEDGKVTFIGNYDPVVLKQALLAQCRQDRQCLPRHFQGRHQHCQPSTFLRDELRRRHRYRHCHHWAGKRQQQCRPLVRPAGPPDFK